MCGVNRLLLFGNTVDQSKLLGEGIVRVDQQRKAQLVLIVHEEGLFLGLRGNRDQRGSRGLDFIRDGIHRFHLANAEGTPTAANEQDHQPSLGEQIGRRNELAVVVRKFECGGMLSPTLSALACDSLSFEPSDASSMDSLHFRRNILGDRFLALGENLTQRPHVGYELRFRKRAPLHIEPTKVGVLGFLAAWLTADG